MRMIAERGRGGGVEGKGEEEEEGGQEVGNVEGMSIEEMGFNLL